MNWLLRISFSNQCKFSETDYSYTTWVLIIDALIVEYFLPPISVNPQKQSILTPVWAFPWIFYLCSLMLQNRLVIKLVAFVLIVLLSQKAGFGIYFHNSQHIQVANTKCDEHSVGITSFHCNCIDDFSMPFTETDDTINSFSPVFLQNFIASPTNSVVNTSRFFNSLRAPPSLLS
jgi:hypothetical protein